MVPKNRRLPSRSLGVNIQVGPCSVLRMKKGLIDKDQGEMGPVEEKWGVDIVLTQQDYDPCLTMYGSSSVDAVCITNMDALAPSLGFEIPLPFCQRQPVPVPMRASSQELTVLKTWRANRHTDWKCPFLNMLSNGTWN